MAMSVEMHTINETIDNKLANLAIYGYIWLLYIVGLLVTFAF